jgi:hypothetical protein
MNDLRSAIREAVEQARKNGSKVIALTTIEQLIGPERHQLHIRDVNGGWNIQHTRACRQAECDLAVLVRTCLLVSSPHAVGRTYEVWFEDGALKFQGITQ